MKAKEILISLAQCSIVALILEKRAFCTLGALLCAIRAWDHRKENNSITSLNCLSLALCLVTLKKPELTIPTVIALAITAESSGKTIWETIKGKTNERSDETGRS